MLMHQIIKNVNICLLNVKLDQRLSMAYKYFKRERERERGGRGPGGWVGGERITFILKLSEVGNISLVHIVGRKPQNENKIVLIHLFYQLLTEN